MKIRQDEETCGNKKGAEEACSRQVKQGRRKQLIKIVGYIGEEDFHRLTAFYAGYEAGCKKVMTSNCKTEEEG